MRTTHDWLEEQAAKIRELAEPARRNPGWADSDFEHHSTPEMDTYGKALAEIPRYIEQLAAPEGWLEVGQWCQVHDDVFGGIDVDMFVDWNEEKHAVNQYLLREMVRRIRLRSVLDDEGIWQDNRIEGMIVNTRWFMPPLRAADEDLITLLHFMGEDGKFARKILNEDQLAKLKFIDEKKKYIKVTGMEVEMDKKYVSLRVDFKQSLPRGYQAGFEVSEFDGNWVGRVAHNLDVTIYSHGDDTFTADAFVEGGKIEKGKNWVKIYRPRGGWKPWDIEPGTELILHVYVSCKTSIMKEKLGDNWFPVPGAAYYCATCIAPDYVD